MSSTHDKLQYLEETKRAIRDILDPDGTKITDDMPFREYVNFIESDTVSGFVERNDISLTCNANTVADYAFYQNSTIQTVDLPMVTSIGSHAFDGCYNLKSANIPSVVDVYDSAFMGANRLVSIDLPMATSIGFSAFHSCIRLTDVKIPKVSRINNGTFAYCRALAVLRLPMVTHIDTAAFRECSNLSAIILEQQCTLNYDEYMFSNTPIINGTGYIYVPSALVDWYNTEETWLEVTNQIRALEDYTVDGTIDGELDPEKISAVTTT